MALVITLYALAVAFATIEGLMIAHRWKLNDFPESFFWLSAIVIASFMTTLLAAAYRLDFLICH